MFVNQPYGARVSLALLLSITALVFSAQPTVAQQTPQGEDAPLAEPTSADDLAYQQSQLADRFARLESLMLRSAEFDAATNPRRSALLRQALRQSKDRFIRLQMESLVEMVRQDKLSGAIDKQRQVLDELEALLQLLLTENRSDRLKSEQQRVRSYIQELERIIRQHRSVQGRTEGGDDIKQVSKDQGRVADRTGQLRQRIDENEGSDQTEGQGQKPGDEEPDSGGAGDQDEKTPPGGDADRAPDERPNGQERDGPGQDPAEDQGKRQGPEQTPAESGQQDSQQGPTPPGGQSPGQPQGQQGDGQPRGQQGEGQPQGQGGSATPPDEQPYPGRQRIAEAEQTMREAQQRLDEARRNDAVEEQEEARRLLEEAKAELEQILRQMREEEIERMLALLEARCRKMLQMQLEVYERTKQLDQTPLAQRGREVDIEAGKLSLQERRIVVEADNTLVLLREEGSSVAFPEAFEQLRTDMEQVADRLTATKIDAVTQGIEQDIIAALEEMIETLERAQEEQSERNQNQQPPPPGEMEEPPLVDALAELKLIKALQLRVNKRTNHYAQMLGNRDDPVGQATDPELIEAIQRLSEREKRIFQITRDLVLGKNR
jgi:hypothetical protein